MQKIGALISVLSLVVGGVTAPLTVHAASPHVAAIQIDTLNGNSPGSYSTSCTGDNPLHSPVTVIGTGTVTGPLGSGPDKYHVSIDWGNGVPEEVSSTFTVLPSGDYTFTFTGGPHTYGATSVTSITANVYHQNSSGHDTPDASSLTISLCITPVVHTITSSADTNSSISPLGATIVNDGADSPAFSWAANAGYHILQVLIDGIEQAIGSPYTFTNVTADHTLAVTSELDAVTTYTITSSAGAGGTISPTPSATVNDGDTPTFTMTPNAGYHVADVTVDGSSVGRASSYTFPAVHANHAIVATFEIDTFTITASAGANGSVAPNGITTVPYGGGQTYTITADSGYHILDVLVNSLSVGPVTSYPFTNVTQNHLISAMFERVFLNIAASVDGGHGTISPEGNTVVAAGDNQAFTFTPDTGYDVDTVLVDGVSVSTSSPYTFTSVDTGHTIVVKFKGILECNDGIDNDGDGYVDLLDGGCSDANDNSENSAPVADSQSVSTFKDTAKSITLAASDAESDPLTYTVGSPSHGTLSGTAPNLTYTPTAGYTGADSFTFTVNDGTVDSNTATVSIDVNPPVTQCNDKVDNDGDELSDSADPGCHTDGDASNEGSYDPSIDNEARADVCTNIDGYQESVPQGYYANETTCLPSGGSSTTSTVVGGPSVFSVPGQVLGTSTEGQVLGESCGLYMDQHLRRGGSKNDTAQVGKLQDFLNRHMGANLPLSGYFGSLTEAAVKAFQSKYADDVLKPWGLTKPTGLAYLTTLRQVNLIECPELTLETPTLVPWSQNPNAQ